MKYCPNCGTGHECSVTGELDRTAVELMRLQTNRDIEVARLSAGAAKHIADVEAENSAEHAEGVAEGMETALEAVSGGGAEDAGEPEGDPIVIDDGTDAEDVTEAEDDITPPVVVPDAGPAKPAGWWSGYSASRR